MAVIKCKMCGGDLELLEDSSVCECEYCGTKQTVPKADDEKKLKLFERANRLRTACEFDKAAGVYETIVADFDQEAEAYWGLILCKFGIEYVDDPATGKKIPTCHRSSFESLMDDPNFEMVMECADPIARRVYREEAKQIEELRRRIIEVSSKEEPYDVFISYKELAEDGQRTLDSVIAQDICTELTDWGYRVFFSRISLESKLGVEYEPYIFAALNSAKVMLVVGTDYDYFNAVWVKNEWSRFLALIARGEKKTLIPVFKGIDAYDMPKEFSKLAAQDMGKVGAMQDLIRGVEKIIGRKQPEPAAQPQQVIQGGGPNVASLLDRGNMALEDGEWDKAKEFFDQVLNMDSRCGEAYLGLAMAEDHFESRESYRKAFIAIDSNLRNNKSFVRAVKYADPVLSEWFKQLNKEADQIKETAEREKKDKIYKYAMHKLANKNLHPEMLDEARQAFAQLGSYQDAADRMKECDQLIKQREEKRKAEEEKERQQKLNAFLQLKKQFENAKTIPEYKKVKAALQSLALQNQEKFEYIRRCDTAILELESSQREEAARIAREKMIEEGKKTGKEAAYTAACEAFDAAKELGQYQEVKSRFNSLLPYRNKECKEYISKCESMIDKLLQECATQRPKANQNAAAQKMEHERKATAAKAASEKAEAERRAKQKSLIFERSSLQAELANLRGLFSGKRRREIEGRLAQIEAELKKLG